MRKSLMCWVKLPAPLIGELPYLPRAEQRELGRSHIRLAMLRSVLAESGR